MFTSKVRQGPYPFIESGENANGHYIQWSNGIQICMQGSAKAGTHSSGDTITYAKAFVEEPVVVLGSISSSGGYFPSNGTSNNGPGLTTYLWYALFHDGTAYSSTTTEIRDFIIGVWKK